MTDLDEQLGRCRADVGKRGRDPGAVDPGDQHVRHDARLRRGRRLRLGRSRLHPVIPSHLECLEWIEHRLPRVGRTQDGASSPTLTALGPRAVYYEVQADDTQTPTGFFSADSGTTWTPVAVGVNGTTQTIPAAAEVRATCPPGGTDPCDTIALTARSPSDGRLLKLAHQPTWCRSR